MGPRHSRSLGLALLHYEAYVSNKNVHFFSAKTCCGFDKVLWNMLQFEDKHHSGLLKMIADQLQCSPADIVDFELNVCDTQDGVIGGTALMVRPFTCYPALSCIYTNAFWP